MPRSRQLTLLALCAISFTLVAVQLVKAGDGPPCEFDPKDECNILPPTSLCPEGYYYHSGSCPPGDCCEWCDQHPGPEIVMCDPNEGCIIPQGALPPSVSCACEITLPACWICTTLDSSCPAVPQVGGVLTFGLNIMSTCNQEGPYTWTICRGDDLVEPLDPLTPPSAGSTLRLRVIGSGTITVRGSVPGPGCAGPFQIAQTVIIPPRCSGDVDNNGTVNVTDLMAVINSWGAPGCAGDPCCIADLDFDGDVDNDDLFMVINGWGPCP